MLDLVKQAVGAAAARAPVPAAFDQAALHKCTGVVLLYYVRRAICSEYHLTAAKLQRHATGTAHSTSLGGRQPRSAVILSFLAQLSTYVRRVAALSFDAAGAAVVADADADAWRSALAFLQGELEEVVLHDAARSDAGALGRRQVGVAVGPRAPRQTERRRRRAKSSSSSSSSESSESSSESSTSATDEEGVSRLVPSFLFSRFFLISLLVP
ncbi:hypothetical protein STCU_12387 [Strigomonas culicis]|uniref:Uncharacterized protein n=1 Tax=Strigomonas culicis TaxID=28005 RepID=S9UK21_9TRYP|nr:hypothetical protein STCU_12387 [Strigomonas culicis]|eukprot:EPY15031.1 hypothetical protein STCU_12387 [Strigomonas culicis]